MSLDLRQIVAQLQELSLMNDGRDVQLGIHGNVKITAYDGETSLSEPSMRSPFSNIIYGWNVHVWNPDGSVSMFTDDTTHNNIDKAREYLATRKRP